MNIGEFFIENNRIALAFSGGADSGYLLYAALEAGADVTAYCVRSRFQPRFEYEDALRLADDVGVRMVTIETDVLSDENIASNTPERCYHCKRRILSAIIAASRADGYELVCDGTNASDELDSRPGTAALHELGVLSPLRICGLTKADVRELSKEAGLFIWDKPAYACLATRIPTGSAINVDRLERTEAAEDYLFKLGFTDFRVRMQDEGTALVQLPEGQFVRFAENRVEITRELKKHYDKILLDTEARR